MIEFFKRSQTPVRSNTIRFLFILFSPFFLGGFLLFWGRVLINEIYHIEWNLGALEIPFILLWLFLGWKYFD